MGFRLFKKIETKNWPHQIINFLYEHYGESYTELNRFLYEELNFESNNTTHKDNIKTLLIDLDSEGYVKWKVILMDEDYKTWKQDNYQEEFQKLPHLTLKNHRVEARLTIKGLDYAIELNRERQKHNIYKITTPLSTFFALTAAIMGIANYKGCQKQPELKNQIFLLPQSGKQSTPQIDTPHKTNQNLVLPQQKISKNPFDTTK